MECVSHADHDEYHARAVDDSHPLVRARCEAEFGAHEVRVNLHQDIAEAKRTGKRPCQDRLDELGGAAADKFAR